MKKLINWLTSLSLIITAIVSFSTNCSDNSFNNNISNVASNLKNSDNQLLQQKNPFISHLNNSGISANANIFCLANNNDGTIYAGTSDQGLYTSIDGIVFTKVSSFPNAFVTAIKIDNQGIIWIGTQNQGLYQSINNGKTFKQIEQTSNIEQIDSIFLTTNGTIYLNSKGQGLYRSTDHSNFTKVNNIPNNNNQPVSIAEFGNIIYLGTQQGLYYSSDDGQTFTKVSCILDNIQINAILVANNTILVGTTDGLYRCDAKDIFAKINTIPQDIVVTSLNALFGIDNNIIYVGTNQGLYQSKEYVTLDNITFDKVDQQFNNKVISNIIVTKNDVVYFSYQDQGLWAMNLMYWLLNINHSDYCGDKYDGLVYKNLSLGLNPKYLKSAKLDSDWIATDTQGRGLDSSQKHILTLFLKNNYQQYLNLFTDNPEEITYNFWIKDSISLNEINYQLNTSDTDLITGLVSSGGNTDGSPIIETKIKENTGLHSAPLSLDITSDMIDFKNSYYVAGNVDKSKNNFTATPGTEQTLQLGTNNISHDGIYHLHVVDLVGNSYDSYLQLGSDNWKLSYDKDNFDDKQLINLAGKLNVSINLIKFIHIEDKEQAMIWLYNYQFKADQAFLKSANNNKNSKGFDISFNNLPNQYQSFLDPVVYINSATKESINQEELKQAISYLANTYLQNGLNNLPQNLNIDTSYVNNKTRLDQYTTWVTGYQNYLNDKKEYLINSIIKTTTHGFATDEELRAIKEYANKLIYHDLEKITWGVELTLTLETNDYYSQFVDWNSWQNSVIDWIKNKINDPDPNQLYLQALKETENKVDMHGYSLQQILHGKSLPQTKQEIANYADGKSFSQWLQETANIKYYHWQLTMGLSTGFSTLLTILLIIALCFYWNLKKMDPGWGLREMQMVNREYMKEYLKNSKAQSSYQNSLNPEKNKKKKKLGKK